VPAAARKPAPRKAPRSSRKRKSGRAPKPRAFREAKISEKPFAVRAADEIARQLLRAYRLIQVDPASVVAEAASRGLHVTTLAELRAVAQPKRDALATTFIKSAKIWATGHGTSLGAAGIVTMAADIAALVAVNLRMIQHVSLSYGVEPAPERIDAWAILLAALGQPTDPKAARDVPRAQAAPAVTRLVSEIAQMFAKRLLRSGSAGRAVPLVGAVFGGLSNYAFTAQVGTRAREFYKSLAP
jgi:hypothetical protein